MLDDSCDRLGAVNRGILGDRDDFASNYRGDGEGVIFALKKLPLNGLQMLFVCRLFLAV